MFGFRVKKSCGRVIQLRDGGRGKEGRKEARQHAILFGELRERGGTAGKKGANHRESGARGTPRIRQGNTAARQAGVGHGMREGNNGGSVRGEVANWRREDRARGARARKKLLPS